MTSRTTLRRGRRAALVLIGTLAALGGIAAPVQAQTSGPHIATPCGGSADPTIDGGAAHWEVTCTADNATVSGWVEDIRADFSDACLSETWPENRFIARTQGYGTRETFWFTSFRPHGDNVDLKLSLCS